MQRSSSRANIGLRVQRPHRRSIVRRCVRAICDKQAVGRGLVDGPCASCSKKALSNGACRHVALRDRVCRACRRRRGAGWHDPVFYRWPSTGRCGQGGRRWERFPGRGGCFDIIIARLLAIRRRSAAGLLVVCVSGHPDIATLPGSRLRANTTVIPTLPYCCTVLPEPLSASAPESCLIHPQGLQDLSARRHFAATSFLFPLNPASFSRCPRPHSICSKPRAWRSVAQRPLQAHV